MTFNKKLNVEKANLDIDKTRLKDVLVLCSPSERYVLVEKYWLITGKERYLQSIWNDFDMSRERIRQIEAKWLNKIRRLVLIKDEFNIVYSIAKAILQENHWIMSEWWLIQELLARDDVSLSANELRLLLVSDFDIYYLSRNKFFMKWFYLDPIFEDLLTEIYKFTTEYLVSKGSSEKQDLMAEKLKKVFLDRFSRNISLISYLNNDNFYLQVLVLVRTMHLFDWKVGLEHHEDVNPKTIKLKLQYLLRRWVAPVHYAELGKRMEDTFNMVSVKLTTVHNELVKNNSIFVNMWMWMYWLKEWWIKWWNTVDIVLRMLKKAKRPFKVREIVKEVLREKMVREVTVLMVLQKNKDLFERVEKWVYKLRKK